MSDVRNFVSDLYAEFPNLAKIQMDKAVQEYEALRDSRLEFTGRDELVNDFAMRSPNRSGSIARNQIFDILGSGDRKGAAELRHQLWENLDFDGLKLFDDLQRLNPEEVALRAGKADRIRNHLEEEAMVSLQDEMLAAVDPSIAETGLDLLALRRGPERSKKEVLEFAKKHGVSVGDITENSYVTANNKVVDAKTLALIDRELAKDPDKVNYSQLAEMVTGVDNGWLDNGSIGAEIYTAMRNARAEGVKLTPEMINRLYSDQAVYSGNEDGTLDGAFTSWFGGANQHENFSGQLKALAKLTRAHEQTLQKKDIERERLKNAISSPELQAMILSRHGDNEADILTDLLTSKDSAISDLIYGNGNNHRRNEVRGQRQIIALKDNDAAFAEIAAKAADYAHYNSSSTLTSNGPMTAVRDTVDIKPKLSAYDVAYAMEKLKNIPDNANKRDLIRMIKKAS